MALLLITGGVVCILFTEFMNRLGWIRVPVGLPVNPRAGGIIAGAVMILYGLLIALRLITVK